ncbi:unnamed protein product [Adineta ricciae]|uniref:HTH CENPB-type domain-containing protein n=1 Tax=Adineta ricciae TaxID=249248 RepID=A0A815LU82_ADIRI|nr:unnamed protein product [Adineta ricciae]CAF1410471.1 unnamed protein product [Adineta ricciae]
MEKIKKRFKGGGMKIHYEEFDRQLIQWFKSQRTDIDDEQSKGPGEIKKKNELLSKIQTYPSRKWFYRFRKRHSLSLQRPKRQQKISLVEAHIRVTEFLIFIRKNAFRVLNLDVLGSFPDRDICKMDENPLALFGDQSKTSINYINTPNEVEGHQNNKRFCTLIVKDEYWKKKEKHYDEDTKVYFSNTAFNNSSNMKSYAEHWLSKTKDGRPKMFITDSYSSHLTEEVKALSKRNGVILRVIPSAITQYVQVLDVSVFSGFKAHYLDVAEE